MTELKTMGQMTSPYAEEVCSECGWKFSSKDIVKHVGSAVCKIMVLERDLESRDFRKASQGMRYAVSYVSALTNEQIQALLKSGHLVLAATHYRGGQDTNEFWIQLWLASYLNKLQSTHKSQADYRQVCEEVFPVLLGEDSLARDELLLRMDLEWEKQINQ